MSEPIANQSEESPIEVERDADTEAMFESFGLAPKQAPKKDIEFPNMDEPTEPLIMEDEEEEIHQEEPTPTPEKRTLKLKYNGEDKEVDEEEARTLAQKGMNYDKVQQKVTEQQKALDEVAQLQGFKDHADLIANLPKLREQQQKKEAEAFNKLRTDLRQHAEDAGLDPDQVEAYLDNHPLVKEAQKAKEERDAERAERQRETQVQEWTNKWNALYQAYPDLAESAKVFSEGGTPEWYTADMKSRIEKGYDPVDAYKLAHSDRITAQSKKATEQKLIRQQQLGVRGQINSNTATPPDEASLLPVQMSLAEEFGVSVKGVQKQNQLLKSRR